MNPYVGLYPEFDERTNKWNVCFPDGTICERGIGSRGWCTRIINEYIQMGYDLNATGDIRYEQSKSR